MKKKFSKILIAVMIAVMVIPTVNYSFAETTSQQGTDVEVQETDKATTGSDTATPEDGTTEEVTDSSHKSEEEVVGNSEASEAPSAGDSIKGSEETVAEKVTEEMKFLYIDNRELAAPGTQNIVVSWDSSLDNIEEMQLMYEGPSGEELSLKESNRTDSSVLFTRDFKASEQGTYTIKGVKYFIDGEEYYFEFDTVEIDATFTVTAPTENEENVVDVEVNENGTINKKEVSNDIDTALATASAGTPLKAARSAKGGNVVVVLDPGHGGSDPGAVGNGLYEKNLTLQIAKYCKVELEQYSGIEVYMTRETDKDVAGSSATATQELQSRVDVGKKYGADLLISIHINAGGGTGFEIYYPTNNYNATVGTEGKAAASQIEKELKALGLTDRGIKTKYADSYKYADGSRADYYGITRMSKIAGFPGLIVEHAFIDRASDAAFLKSEANLKKLGVADATGIAKYFGLSKNGLFHDENGWRFKNKDGTYFEKGWKVINGKNYYFEKGYALIGWQEVDGSKYYFMPDGYAITGWFKFGSTYYYANSKGVVQTGNVTINGKEYNFDSTGKLIKGTAIKGRSAVSVNQMISYYEKSGKKYPSSIYRTKGAPDIETFCKIYYEEAEDEGIRVEVAFCQAMKETGWLQFGGDVKASQCNFAGLGATGRGVSGETFKDVRTGIRAHIQHLKAYANSEPLNNPLVDPRFKYVDRGCAPYVEWLGQKENPDGKGWATAKGYGQSIVSMMKQLLAQ